MRELCVPERPQKVLIMPTKLLKLLAVLIMLVCLPAHAALPSLQNVRDRCRKVFFKSYAALTDLKVRAQDTPRTFRDLSIETLKIDPSLDIELANLNQDISPKQYMKNFYGVFVEYLFKNMSPKEVVHIKDTISWQKAADFENKTSDLPPMYALLQVLKSRDDIFSLTLESAKNARDVELSDLFKMSVVLRSVTHHFKELRDKNLFHINEIHEIGHLVDNILKFRNQGIAGVFSTMHDVDFKTLESEERFAISLEWEFISRLPLSIRKYFLHEIEIRLRELNVWQNELASSRPVTMESLILKGVHLDNEGNMMSPQGLIIRYSELRKRNLSFPYLYSSYRALREAGLSKKEYVRRALLLRYPIQETKKNLEQ